MAARRTRPLTTDIAKRHSVQSVTVALCRTKKEVRALSLRQFLTEIASSCSESPSTTCAKGMPNLNATLLIHQSARSNRQPKSVHGMESLQLAQPRACLPPAPGLFPGDKQIIHGDIQRLYGCIHWVLSSLSARRLDLASFLLPPSLLPVTCHA